MSFFQQVQQIPSQAKSISSSSYLPHIAVGIIIALETIALVAGQVFALFATAALLIGVCCYLQDRFVTKIVAATLTVLIIAISAAALFPASSMIILGCGAAIGSVGIAYTLYKLVKSSSS